MKIRSKRSFQTIYWLELRLNYIFKSFQNHGIHNDFTRFIVGQLTIFTRFLQNRVTKLNSTYNLYIAKNLCISDLQTLYKSGFIISTRFKLYKDIYCVFFPFCFTFFLLLLELCVLKLTILFNFKIIMFFII